MTNHAEMPQMPERGFVNLFMKMAGDQTPPGKLEKTLYEALVVKTA
jgi:hypothetical protein